MYTFRTVNHPYQKISAAERYAPVIKPVPIKPSLSKPPIVETKKCVEKVMPEIEVKLPSVETHSSKPLAPSSPLPDTIMADVDRSSFGGKRPRSAVLDSPDLSATQPDCEPEPFDLAEPSQNLVEYPTVDYEPEPCQSLSDTELPELPAAPADVSEPSAKKKKGKAKQPVDTVECNALRAELFKLRTHNIASLYALTKNADSDPQTVIAAKALMDSSLRRKVEPSALFQACSDAGYKAAWRDAKKSNKERKLKATLAEEDAARGITQ
jgi:hypothetical protein